MKIDSDDKEISEILGSRYYQIPRFQRPYSWEPEHITEFWNDTIVDSDSDYFIGSMVVFTNKNSPTNIVDGQQRLTTITMILCAIRDALKSEGFLKLAHGVHLSIERPDRNNEPQFVVNPESSFPYFQEVIQSFDEPEINIEIKDEEKTLQRAFNQINKFIQDAIDSIKKDSTISRDRKSELIKDRLINIRDKILSLKLILVELDNEDDAYIIFETLNTRGKDLAVSDLVKNLVFKLSKTRNRKVDTPKIQWTRILSTISGSSAEISVDEFLHHFWLSKYEYVTMKKLFKRIKKTISSSTVKHFLNNLESDSRTYREIHEPSYRNWRVEQRRIEYALRAYGIFRIKQQIPMVLAVMRDYRDEILKKKEVERILVAIEKFHFTFTAITSQRSSGGISQMYASSARKLTEAKQRKDKLEILDDLYKKLRERVPSYQEFEANFLELYFTEGYTTQKKLVQYILSKYHRHFGNPDIQDMTIEHITPQNIGKDDIERESNVGQVGNLIFVPTELNQSLNAKDFETKRKILIESGVKLDEPLLKAKQWSPAEIEQRTKWLAELAYNKIWKI